MFKEPLGVSGVTDSVVKVGCSVEWSSFGL